MASENARPFVLGHDTENKAADAFEDAIGAGPKPYVIVPESWVRPEMLVGHREGKCPRTIAGVRAVAGVVCGRVERMIGYGILRQRPSGRIDILTEDHAPFDHGRVLAVLDRKISMPTDDMYRWPAVGRGHLEVEEDTNDSS